MPKYPKIDRTEHKRLLDAGWLVKGASLYEPDHAPEGTKFAYREDRGLHRLTPPKSDFAFKGPPDV